MGPDYFEESGDDDSMEETVIINKIDEHDLSDLEEDMMEDLEDEEFDLDF